jgi:hypothetical protein
MKIENNKIRAMTTITSLIIGLMLLSPTLVLPNINAATDQNTTASADVLSPECKKKAYAMISELEGKMDEKKSNSLAITSSDLADKTAKLEQAMGDKLDIKYNGLQDSWNIDPVTCTPTLDKVSASYFLDDKSGNVKRVAVVTMDSQLSKIEKTEDYEPKYATTGTATLWAGYDFGGNAGYTTTVTAADNSFSYPTVSKPTNDNCFLSNTNHTPDCDLRVWAGLTDSLGGASTGHLIQGGAGTEISCNSSGGACTTTYSLWHEELPNPIVTFTTLTPGGTHNVQTDILQNTSTPSTYDTYVRDSASTTVWHSTTTGYAMTAPTHADFMHERPNTVFTDNTKKPSILPVFSVTTVGASLDYGGVSHPIGPTLTNIGVSMTSDGTATGTLLAQQGALSSSSNTFTVTFKNSK